MKAAGAAAAIALALAGCSSSKSSTAATAAPTTTAAPATATTAAPETTTTAAAQTLTITPSTGLKDGQMVQLVGKGYTAGKTYGVTECADKGNATGAGDCDLRGIKISSPADSSGTVTYNFVVAKGPFGSNNIVCSASQACLVSLATPGVPSPTEVASANITFSS